MEEQIWLSLSVKGYTLEPFFKLNGIKTIAIYGCSHLGEYLYEEVTKYGIDVKFCIDKEVNAFHGVTVVHPSSLDTAPDVDLVVVCVSKGRTYRIQKVLREVGLSYITLLRILQICYYKEILLPFCESLGLTAYIFSHTYLLSLKNLSALEKKISALSVEASYLSDNPSYFAALYSDVNEYSDEYIRAVFTQSPLVRRNNTFMHSDMRSKYVNIIQGSRLTTNIPEFYSRTIHVIGNCTVLGFGVDDSRTVQSCLQRMLNDISDEYGHIKVVNHGVWGLTMCNNPYECLKKLESLTLNQGDIVVIFNDIFRFYSSLIDKCYTNVLNNKRNIYFSLYYDFCQARDYPLYFDEAHLSSYGMERAAKFMIKVLKSENALSVSNKQKETQYFTSDSNAKDYLDKDILQPKTLRLKREGCPTSFSKIDNQLDEYISFLKSHRMKGIGDSGAIVMNCNPFTNGHRYLIESASKQVDFLYIFVVEEDKSNFSFNDRLMLVEHGTAGLKNVIVLPSGKFIISTITFPEYFVKDAMKEISVDTSLDIEIFAQKIAPVLNISKRFVGEEPFDPITKQYNQTMKDILPKYNIELVEFKRYEIDENPVSASWVRKLLESNKLEEISKLVPITTLQFLQNKI